MCHCHSMMGLTRCYKTVVFLRFIFAFFDLNPQLRYYHFRVQKTNERHMEILHPVSTLNFISSSSCNYARTKQILSEWTITERVITLCRLSRLRPYRRKYSFAFWFYDISPSERQRTICVLNFNQISQSTAKLLLLLVQKQ